MALQKTQAISLLRAIGFLLVGVVCGIQLALYLYDYYEDGVAELTSLLIGLGMVALATGWVLFSFRKHKKEAVLRLVEEALASDEVNAPEGSFLEGVEHLVGSVDGPRDLSTNPKHLDGFGRKG